MPLNIPPDYNQTYAPFNAGYGPGNIYLNEELIGGLIAMAAFAGMGVVALLTRAAVVAGTSPYVTLNGTRYFLTLENAMRVETAMLAAETFGTPISVEVSNLMLESLIFETAFNAGTLTMSVDALLALHAYDTSFNSGNYNYMGWWQSGVGGPAPGVGGPGGGGGGLGGGLGGNPGGGVGGLVGPSGTFPGFTGPGGGGAPSAGYWLCKWETYCLLIH